MAANASEPTSAAAPAVRGTSGDIRRLIAKAKRWDVIFIVLGILALGVGFLTFLAVRRRQAFCRRGSGRRW